MKEGTTQAVVQHLIDGGLTKYRISKILGVSPIMVSNWLCTSRMSTDNACKVKAIWDITITDVYSKVSS